MIAFSRAASTDDRERLLELAVLVREPDDDQPIAVVSVARPGSRTAAELADIETGFTAIESAAAGADVPIERETRIEEPVAAGIARTTFENRITTLIVGWDGEVTRRQRVFGDVIDGVLARTNQQVLVSHVHRPLNTTREIIVVLPPGVDRNDAFYEVVHTIAQLADELGTSIRGLAVGRSPEGYARLFDLVAPDVPTSVERVAGWDDGYERLEHAVDETALVVAVSVRREMQGWHPELRSLPTRLSSGVVGTANVVVLYPAVGDREDDRRFLQLE